MVHPTPAPRARQVCRFHDRFTHARGLPLADLLPSNQVEQALQAEGATRRDCLYSPAGHALALLGTSLRAPPL